MTTTDFVAALRARPDGDTFLRDEGEFMLLYIIEYDLCLFDLDRKDSKEARMIQRLEEEGVSEPTEIVFYDADSLSSLKCIIDNGFDPKTLTKEEIYEKMEIKGRRAIFDTSLDRLHVCNLGLPLDRKDFFIVNEEDVR